MSRAESLFGRTTQTLYAAQHALLRHRYRLFRWFRSSRFGCDLSLFHAPGRKGLVSIVLPVRNGATLLPQAIESVLAQDYSHWELLIINDGSSDDTPYVSESYAARDKRIRVLHQENRKIPRTLSRGFRLVEGEFLTWLSADNRLLPNFCRRFASCFSRHPALDVAYANEDLIDAKGDPYQSSPHFPSHQHPKGSHHIHLPHDTSVLHGDGNFVGAAFMYRSRVAHLLGDYSKHRFTVEDYDYWLLANTLLSVHHVDFLEPIYEYRFHEDSLTSHAKELQIHKAHKQLLEWDRFRQSLSLAPLVFVLESADRDSFSSEINHTAQILRQLGHTLLTCDELPKNRSESKVPALYLQLGSLEAGCKPPPLDPSLYVFSALLFVGDMQIPPPSVHPAWDVAWVWGNAPNIRLGYEATAYQGLCSTPDLPTLIRALDCRARVDWFRRLEDRHFTQN